MESGIEVPPPSYEAVVGDGASGYDRISNGGSAYSSLQRTAGEPSQRSTVSVFRCAITAVECTGCTVHWLHNQLVNSADPDEAAPAGAASSGSTLFTDSPHESDDEETKLLKAELRRLRQEKLDQKKKLLRNEIGRERTYSGTGWGNSSAAMNGSQTYSGTAQQHPIVYSSTPQIAPNSMTSSGGAIMHPMATYSPDNDDNDDQPSPSGTENGTGNKDQTGGLACVIGFVIFIGVSLVILALLVT